VRGWILGFAILVGCSSSASTEAQSPKKGCDSKLGEYVAVHHATHELILCSRGTAVRSFDVRLAANGIGKEREGDKKLPLGTYPLGAAVTSARFGKFLPVGYPTPEQRSRGMTGSAVGVHGPAREAAWLGSLLNTFDTTDGCVGLAHDEEVAAIDQFVRTRGVRVIVIVID